MVAQDLCFLEGISDVQIRYLVLSCAYGQRPQVPRGPFVNAHMGHER